SHAGALDGRRPATSARGGSMTWRLWFGVWLAVSIVPAIPSVAQPIDQQLYLRKNEDQLENHYRDRLLSISYVVNTRHTGEVNFVRGTAFLVSAGGYAITARHVLERALDFENFDALSFKIEYADGGQIYQAKLASDSILQSRTSDITSFRVTKPSGEEFNKYLCVELTNLWTAPSGITHLATLQFFNRQPAEWQLVQRPVRIDQRHGPQDLFDYLAISETLEDSMSGGAILIDGRVIAVVSNSLMEGDKPVPSGNYGNLLRYAEDTAWRGRAD